MANKDENKKFKSLKGNVSLASLKALKEMGFKIMTDIQSEVLPQALDGRDIVATAKTGSGKTLAFLIPSVEVVIKHIEKQLQGTCCIIISPTRELAIQTYTVLQDLVVYHHTITSALIIGGESRKKQSVKLSTGVHIVIATPGRLFDHMRTKEFDYRNVSCLVLDEADKIFQYGFEEDLKQIINRLPKNRQTMLFSATQSERTEALIKSAMQDNVLNINVDEDNLKATVEGLKQGYAVCETEYRLWWLHKLLKKTKNYKIMVFFSSCKSVEFHYEFFTKYSSSSVLCIHGKMSQADRTDVITKFYNAENIALFCTDLAARGLDIPAIDWIVQFDPPADANEYIHRVGRTARGMGAEGNAVLLLRPEEKEFVEYLKESKIYLDKYETWDTYYNLQPKCRLTKAQEIGNLSVKDSSHLDLFFSYYTEFKVKDAAAAIEEFGFRFRQFHFSDILNESDKDSSDIQERFYEMFFKLDAAMSDPHFHQLAVEAFEGYMRAFEVKKLKQIFNLLTMDVDAVARSFGLKERPEVDVRIGFSKKHRPRKRIAAMLAEKSVENSKKIK